MQFHYDKNGRPSGSADLIYARISDALQAQKRYNNVQLDGKPMKIEIIGGNAEIPLSARLNVVGGGNERKRTEYFGYVSIDFLHLLVYRNYVIPVENFFIPFGGCAIFEKTLVVFFKL